MTLSGVLSSPFQKRIFLFTSFVVLAVSVGGVFLIAILAPPTPIWSALSNLLISVVASGAFALMSGLYLTYLFVDPNDLAARSSILPQDIGTALERIASNATDYRIFVRTGRHFRSDILPILVRQARQSRRRMQVRVILLDLRNAAVCERYANFRRTSSFDHKLWSVDHVRTEVLATILALIQASRENLGLIDIELFLTTRLSTFRIEGTADELLVTREDPKDTAMRFRRSDSDYSAFSTELDWICADAFRVENQGDGSLPTAITSIVYDKEIIRLEPKAKSSLANPSPYVR
ncbi:hypothetical protein U0C82_16645 [Fulvimarina sp. 2208YS6-2-32]|uniref:Uncharacterized protein n=1 Tax=Fulvimarina uroteuthidis TaxID=3098149 RepID=A0ABU5I6D1_9HYPH|nr:hypothetical protein [Fulvimarina sp. 2208YS6-2-32]MDY8110771.1 hypothetical protein [Fulvimarina sp. 2208YS6-2-32]